MSIEFVLTATDFPEAAATALPPAPEPPDCGILAFHLRRGFPLECPRSGRGSAWLERLVRDQEVGGSNPLAPTILDFDKSAGTNRRSSNTEWDACPLLVILEEAGGRFFDWRGERTVRGGSGISTNGLLSNEVLEMLAESEVDTKS